MSFGFSDAFFKDRFRGATSGSGGGGGPQAVGSINTPGGASSSTSGALRVMRTGSANVGGGEWTIEMWLRPSSTAADNGRSGEVTEGANYSGTDANIFWDSDGFTTGQGWILGLDGGRVYCSVTASGGVGTRLATTDLRDGNWHHVAVYRSSSSGLIEIFVDGTREDTGTGPTGDASYPGGGSPTDDEHVLGKEKLDLGFGYDGDYSEVRVSTSRRYNAPTYTVPTAPFTDDANTVVLYHLDENSGTNVADSSGSGSTGTLIGSPAPTWSTADPF